MKLEVDGRSLRLEIVWSDVKAAFKALLPLLTLGAAFLAAPAVQKLGILLGLW